MQGAVREGIRELGTMACSFARTTFQTVAVNFSRDHAFQEQPFDVPMPPSTREQKVCEISD
jgi:hypothetical protein